MWTLLFGQPGSQRNDWSGVSSVRFGTRCNSLGDTGSIKKFTIINRWKHFRQKDQSSSEIRLRRVVSFRISIVKLGGMENKTLSWGCFWNFRTVLRVSFSFECNIHLPERDQKKPRSMKKRNTWRAIHHKNIIKLAVRLVEKHLVKEISIWLERTSQLWNLSVPLWCHVTVTRESEEK